MEEKPKQTVPCRDCGKPCDKGQCPQCWELTEQLPWSE